jgi:hypothetical protein
MKKLRFLAHSQYLTMKHFVPSATLPYQNHVYLTHIKGRHKLTTINVLKKMRDGNFVLILILLTWRIW